MPQKLIYMDKHEVYWLAETDRYTRREEKYDLEDLLQRVSQNPLSITYEARGDSFIFHKCERNEAQKTYEIQIVRLHDKILPTKYDTIEHMLKEIELAAHEFAAAFVSAVYDIENRALFLQRSKQVLSPNTFGDMIQSISPEGSLVQLKPCVDNHAINRLNEELIYRSISVIIEDDGASDVDEKHGILGHFARFLRQGRGRELAFELKIGKGNGALDGKAAFSFLKEVHTAEIIQKLTVRTKESDENYVEPIDLIKDRIGYCLRLNETKAEQVTHSRIIAAFRREFERRRK